MIQIRNLTKQYGELKAVNDVSFDVREGETFALLGPNGSGKSTTLKCLAGLIIPESGEIKIGNFDLRSENRKAKNLFTYLPQRVSFPDNLTAREIMQFFCKLRHTSEDRIGSLLNNGHFDFNGFSDKPVSEFSGGMNQRLGLAVACLPDAPIMILDEPTISLDPEGAIHFRLFLAEMKKGGKTILFSSHMLADVEQLADHVGIMVGGKLLAVESVDSLRNSVTQGCRMRIHLQRTEQQFVTVAKEAGALTAEIDGNSLIVTSAPESRLEILSQIIIRGGQIICFATEVVSLEVFFVRYLHEKQN
ncbi:ABC transporter ATP-binding protein [bacterium]|nr:ABC transporter ATP-binding protein [bacterium]